MSASYALIRFKRTGNIYYGCYEGTSDTMNPYICTPEECYDKDLDCYCSITYCREIAREKDWVFPKGVADLDEVEVFSDYGFGGCFKAVGSESMKMIDCPLDEFGELNWEYIHRGKPKWAEEFEKELEAIWKKDWEE